MIRVWEPPEFGRRRQIDPEVRSPQSVVRSPSSLIAEDDLQVRPEPEGFRCRRQAAVALSEDDHRDETHREEAGQDLDLPAEVPCLEDIARESVGPFEVSFVDRHRQLTQSSRQPA